MSMSTATGARNKEAYTIIFKDKQHKDFYMELPEDRAFPGKKESVRLKN